MLVAGLVKTIYTKSGETGGALLHNSPKSKGILRGVSVAGEGSVRETAASRTETLALIGLGINLGLNISG